MKIMVFLHGTLIMHKNAAGKPRRERVRQVMGNDPTVADFASYIPVGNATRKLEAWHKQGAGICSFSSHETAHDVEKSRVILETHGFPKGPSYYRENGETYKDFAGRGLPDVLIEDDCESIGGEKEMTMTFVTPRIKEKIKSVAAKELGGIDHLPDGLEALLNSDDD